MLNTSKIIAFVATTQPALARAFYGDVLGFTLIGDEASALVFNAHGTMLRVSKVQAQPSASHTVLGWDVPDISTAMKHLIERGVRFERYAGLAQDDLGLCTFPDGTQVAWFTDPDGNILSLTQFIPTSVGTTLLL